MDGGVGDRKEVQGDGMKSRIRCADWCGRGCTEAEFQAAKKGAARLVKQLGTGWIPRVWENLGWHFAARTKTNMLHVHPSHKGFVAFISEDRGPGGRWSAHGRTPREAVGKAVKEFRMEFLKLERLDESIRRMEARK